MSVETNDSAARPSCPDSMRQTTGIERLAARKPPILQVETINVCNARCIFCAYPNITRKPEVLPMRIFDKVAREYSEMGGGPVSLTPIAGDPLLDPQLLERYEVLQKYPKINRISFTTNGIAFPRYSDTQIEGLLQKSVAIQFSLGGLEREAYRQLYGVDKLDIVLASVSRVLDIRDASAYDTAIHLAFRTADPGFREQHSERLEDMEKRGISISHLSAFMNYAGQIDQKDIGGLRMAENVPQKEVVCALPLVNLVVCSNGKITLCGCVDSNADGLIIGDAHHDTLQACWHGEHRRAVLDAFPSGTLPALCRDCTAYQPSDTCFTSKAFEGFDSCNDTPLEFYLSFFGA